MSSDKTEKNELVDSIDAEEMPSVDDFIKELEEKERDLHISSDLVIEVGESSVEHDNIHDSFVSAFAFSFDKSGSEEVISEPDPDPESEPETDENTELLQQIEELIAERDDLMDTLRRQKIDFENYKGRTERDRKDTFNRILSGLAAQILPVLDNLGRALDTTVDPDNISGDEFKKFAEGIELVNHQLSEVLGEMGVETIPAMGESFDPRYHDAVDCVPSSAHPPNTIIEELVRGYRIGDRIVRPSMVKVSETPPDNSEDHDSSSSDMQ